MLEADASLDDATPALHGAVVAHYSASQLVSDGSTFVGYINAIPRRRPPLSLEEASDRAHELQTGSRRRKKRKPHAPSRRDPAMPALLLPIESRDRRCWGSCARVRAKRNPKAKRAEQADTRYREVCIRAKIVVFSSKWGPAPRCGNEINRRATMLLKERRVCRVSIDV